MTVAYLINANFGASPVRMGIYSTEAGHIYLRKITTGLINVGKKFKGQDTL